MSPQTHVYFRNVRRIRKILSGCYAGVALGNKRDPFRELIFIILSSKTPPERYVATYRSLRSVMPTAESLARAQVSSIERAICFGGLAHRKAMQISGIARALRRIFGRVTLSPLRKMSDVAAEDFLDNLPGVGRKTARCVLMYSLNREVFPVDAHCLRVCRRLGWVDGTIVLTDRVADLIQEGIPADCRHDIHVGMVMLGRDFCRPESVNCLQCPLKRVCATGQQVPQSRSTVIVADSGG